MSSLPVKNSSLIPGRQSENLALAKARAKYVPDYINGGLRLASVCEFSRPVFNPGELVPVADPCDYIPDPDKDRSAAVTPEDKIANMRRAAHRAQVNVFDLAICNRFDLFSTLTFAPENVDRESYEQTYNALKIWLSNRVQRKGLKYVAVPEYHPKSKTAIHFHMLSNSDPVDLIYSGHWRHNQKVYNIPSWQSGFSTAQFISGENAIDFTSKYISKYMTKSGGQKVGGRYYLSGGELIRPTYVYGESIDELLPSAHLVPKFERNISQDWGTFKEISYI